MSQWEKDEVIQRLVEYIKIPSVHPNVNYDDCIKFLLKQASRMDLPVKVFEYVKNKPVLVMTWTGSQPELPAILLNSHMDVVPVYEDHWTYPPFSGHITDDGWIYARGVQDMKALGMIYLEVVKRLKDAGVRLKRTVHISFVPDEEIGGNDGMKMFSESQDFKKLNIGFALDESMCSEDPSTIEVFNGERCLRQIKVTCHGEPGHGSILPVEQTAGEKFLGIIQKFMNYRAAEKQKRDDGTWVGDVTSINLTKVEGGIQVNVLPESLSAYFDVRIKADENLDQFDNMLQSWCTEVGEGVSFEYIQKNPEVGITRTHGDPFWDALYKTVSDMGLKINCHICPGATDARFMRLQEIPAISFTPLINTPRLLHCHNERLHIAEYKRGIDIIEKVLPAIANV